MKRKDTAVMARIEYLGNEMEFADKKEEKELKSDLGAPGFWEFSRNIAYDEIINYKKAIKATKEKIQKTREALKQNPDYNKSKQEIYIRNCQSVIRELKNKIKKAERDIEILSKNKDHRMFRNCDKRYNVPITYGKARF